MRDIHRSIYTQTCYRSATCFKIKWEARKQGYTVKKIWLWIDNFAVDDMRGDPKKTELSSGGWAPCHTGFLPLGEVLGTHLYECTSCCCCERLRSASVIFFWRFNTFAHFMMGDLRVHLPIPHRVFSSFWLKTAWLLYSALPIHPI